MFFNTDATVSGSMEVVATFSKFSRRSSEILSLILLLMCLILGDYFSQMYVLPESDAMNKACS